MEMLKIEKSVLPESIWKEKRRSYWITSRGLSIAIMVLGFHYLHPIVVGLIPFLDFSTSGQLQATGIFVTALLTFILIAVYRDIGETQALQTKIQQQQQEFQRSLERPRVQVEGHRPGDEGKHSVRPLELLLSNIGRSPASNLRLEVVSGFPKDASLQSARTTVPLQRQDEEMDWNRDWGTYLEGDERRVHYTVEPIMVSWKREESDDTEDSQMVAQGIGFGLLHGEIEELLDDNKIRLRGSLLYEGTDNTEYTEQVFDKVIQLAPYVDLGSSLEEGRRPQAIQDEYLITSELDE